MFIAYQLINEGIIHGFNYDLTPNLRKLKNQIKHISMARQLALRVNYNSLSTASANKQKCCAAGKYSAILSQLLSVFWISC